ncbi:malonate decarboxylase holo-ACP synthase [uncultured Massilia sp.]|uniref:malonate decarboxylase holo-ACP synthase n=1 Tax=uncultured Massilia sp. TaxID=169973 RepID=UPI0025DFFCD8|nr:malonate decarboxylase holo-ACP synthase [uncultured Massilia sp.]
MDIVAPCRPHDLLFLRTPPAFDCAGACPEWLDGAWLARAPLVVRRAACAPGRVPVGARGTQRNQRCAGYVAAGAVARRVTPECLARHVLGGGLPASDLPCVVALGTLAPRLAALGLDWGPAGGAGFWLATGLPVLRATSDLDLLVRAPRPLAPATLDALAALQAKAPCRLDIQVDTGAGGFALAEYVRGGRVMLKTAHGPVLVADPWREPAVA